MRSLLVVINEEHLSKGVALALMDHFPRIFITKNPYEAINILREEKVDIIVTELSFNTIETNDYLDNISKSYNNENNVILIYDDSIDINKFKLTPNMLLEPKPISIKKILTIVNNIKDKLLKK